MPHDGYRGGEIPAYRECSCGELVRADRTDLMAEHAAVCPDRRELSDRELDVLRLIADGLTNAEIGAKLWLVEDTVKDHVKRMFKALGAHTRAELVGIAFRRHLIT